VTRRTLHRRHHEEPLFTKLIGRCNGISGRRQCRKQARSQRVRLGLIPEIRSAPRWRDRHKQKTGWPGWSTRRMALVPRWHHQMPDVIGFTTSAVIDACLNRFPGTNHGVPSAKQQHAPPRIITSEQTNILPRRGFSSETTTSSLWQ